MKRNSTAAHRIIGTDTPESIAARKKIRAAVDEEKEDLIAQGRLLMADAKNKKAASLEPTKSQSSIKAQPKR